MNKDFLIALIAKRTEELATAVELDDVSGICQEAYLITALFEDLLSLYPVEDEEEDEEEEEEEESEYDALAQLQDDVLALGDQLLELRKKRMKL